MTGTLKKGVVLLVFLFIGWLLFTDPVGLATLAQDGGTKLWELLVSLFEAVTRFLGAIGE